MRYCWVISYYTYDCEKLNGTQTVLCARFRKLWGRLNGLTNILYRWFRNTNKSVTSTVSYFMDTPIQIYRSMTFYRKKLTFVKLKNCQRREILQHRLLCRFYIHQLFLRKNKDLFWVWVQFRGVLICPDQMDRPVCGFLSDECENPIFQNCCYDIWLYQTIWGPFSECKCHIFWTNFRKFQFCIIWSHEKVAKEKYREKFERLDFENSSRIRTQP